MRPIRTGEEVGGEGSGAEKQILGAVHEAWNMWEIHTLIILSFFLQVFLFLAAGVRRRSTSLLLRTVLWLTYLSADAVAIFVLGHLAVHASEPRHQLMSFWAPFVLVHLGEQDTITAFSKQDNELWRRHLLSLVTQVAVAGYVVAKVSWPDRLLRSAMVLIFISGCIKYAERTWCLFYSDPAWLRSTLLENLSMTLQRIRDKSWNGQPKEFMNRRLKMMSKGRGDFNDMADMVQLFMDAPPNTEESILAADSLPEMLKNFRSSTYRYEAYECVGANLVYCYNTLYTKFRLRSFPFVFYPSLYTDIRNDFKKRDFDSILGCLIISPILLPSALYPLFQLVSAPVALVLFIAAEKGDQLHTSRADIIVTYILLVGAIALDLSSVIMVFLSFCIPSAPWRRKQWSEELGQYSMIKRHVVQETTTGVSSSIRQWIGRRLGGWGVELLELTHTPIIEPIKVLILDNLLLHGTKEEWNVVSSRGLLSVQNWMERQQDHPVSVITGKALEKTIRRDADFPTSMLVWHIATDVCYYYTSGDTAASTTTNNNSIDQAVNKDKEASRQISNYIMYLVFKCGVKLTSNSQHLHDKAHDEIGDILLSPDHEHEKEAFMKIFQAKKKEEDQDHHSTSSSEITQQKHGDDLPAPSDSAAAAGRGNHVQKILQSVEAFDSPVLPRACELAKTLISIINVGEADGWALIAAVWSEMLYYIAPRCGGDFHYEHLSTGGEFATHVLALMHELGPFMPPPDEC